MKPMILAALMNITLVAASPSQLVVNRDRQEALQHYRFGEQALHAERFDEAEREFQAAAKLDPLLDLAAYGLGQVGMATRRYPQAVVAFLRCREVFQANASAALQDETTYQQRLDDQIRTLEDAKHGYETGIARTASNVATIQRLDMQINDLKYRRRRGADRPQGVPAWISIALGSAYFRTDAMSDAEREYRQALKDDARLGEAHNNLAVVLMLTRRYEEAELEVKAAEKAGFHVNPQLKDDLKTAKGASAKPSGPTRN